MLGSLDEDPFGGGVWRRLSGRYPRCGNRAALALHAQRLPEASAARRSDALDQVVAAARAQGGGAAADARHMRRRALLEVWLYVHVPLTFALIAALAAHIVSVFFYW